MIDLAELLEEAALSVGNEQLAARLRAFAASIRPAERGRAQRDLALRQLAIEQYPGLDLQLVADEVATDVRRYAAAGWLLDRAYAVPRPESARDPVRVRLFEAFKASDGKVPVSPKQVARILKPLFEQQKSGHAEGVAMSRKAISSRRVKGQDRMNASALKFDQKAADARKAERLLEAVAASGPGKEAAAKLAAQDLVERKRLVGELEGLEGEELAARQDLADPAQLKEELTALRARVRELEIKLGASTTGKVALSFSFQARRDELHRRLRQTAHPAIAAFVHQMRYEEMDKLRKEQPREASTWTRSAVTGKRVGNSSSNLASIVIRMHAVRRAADDAEALYLQPDQSTVPAQLGELLRNLPDIDEMRPSPQYGSHHLLTDLVNGMELKAALAKHCEK
jgi:hypothetical protein